MKFTQKINTFFDFTILILHVTITKVKYLSVFGGVCHQGISMSFVNRLFVLIRMVKLWINYNFHKRINVCIFRQVYKIEEIIYLNYLLVIMKHVPYNN